MAIYIDFVTDPYAAPGSKTAVLFFLQRFSGSPQFQLRRHALLQTENKPATVR